jgi:nibrin
MDESAAGESQSLGLFISQDLETGIDHEGFPPVTSQTRSGRKRVTPPMEYEEEEDIVDQLAPAAAALKKRRLAEQTARRRRGESTPPPSIKQSPEPKSQLRSKKIKKEIDLLEVARQQREKAEELAIKEREALQEAMNGMDIEAIRNLTIIEEMEVIRRPPPLRAVQADESDRWDDRWNGRKNFKKFRRRGMEDDRIRDFHRVIVPLEEVKKKDFGIGDEYWLDDDSQRRKRKGKGQETQDAFQSQSSPAMPKRGAATRAADILANETLEEQAQPAEDVDEFPSDLEVLEQPPQPPAAVRSQRSQRLEIRTSPSQKTSASNKRPAATSLTKAAPAKKARQTATKRKDESDDSGDEFKFRFRKRN